MQISITYVIDKLLNINYNYELYAKFEWEIKNIITKKIGDKYIATNIRPQGIELYNTRRAYPLFKQMELLKSGQISKKF